MILSEPSSTYCLNITTDSSTEEEDALPPLLGLLSMLSQKYEDGFLCVVPEMYFETGLNWAGWC
jgi:hypothetical protein